jgi:hypothetical protein
MIFAFSLFKSLKEQGALADDESLTLIGKVLSNLPGKVPLPKFLVIYMKNYSPRLLFIEIFY